MCVCVCVSLCSSIVLVKGSIQSTERGRQQQKARKLLSLSLSLRAALTSVSLAFVGDNPSPTDRNIRLCLTYANILAGAVEVALNWNSALAFGVDCKKNIFGMFSLVSWFCIASKFRWFFFFWFYRTDHDG